MSSVFKVSVVRKKKVVIQISRPSSFKISVKEFFLGNIKDYSEMSSFIGIFQGLCLFFRMFQGTSFTENLSNKPFKFELKK